MELGITGHADFPALIKYKGFVDLRGGGIFSGRITLAFVMAGAIAKKTFGNKRYRSFSSYYTNRRG